MTRLHLVRHGRAAAGWDEDPDPGLDDVGRAQAEATAAELAPLGPLPIVCSPLRRTQETAEPLVTRWGVPARLDARVAEIPSPVEDLVERTAWLRVALAGRWTELGPDLLAWRDRMLGALLELREDTVVVTHYVAINAALGAVQGDDRLVIANIANAATTVLEHDGTSLRLVDAPREAPTEVL